MSTPFNTGKVQIGLLHTKPMPQIQGHALHLQLALLDKRTATPLNTFWRVMGSIWRAM